MSETFTLAHFTDVHLSPITGFAPLYWNAKRALGFYNWHRGRRLIHTRDVADRLVADAKTLRADHIVITGDLINLGLPREYEAALGWLRTIGPPESVTVIPGNHDIYSVLHGDPGIARWAHYMGGDAETLAFPFMRRFGNVALIGLNSGVETPAFVAAGELGHQQIEVARDLLQRLGDENAVRVVLIHHPPLQDMASPRRALRDVRAFQRMLERTGVEIVLYGHNHEAKLTWLDTVSGGAAVIGGASASAGRPVRGSALASYNLLTFFETDAGLRVRRSVRGIETVDGDVVLLSEEVLDVGGA